jgi:hypothetical protein
VQNTPLGYKETKSHFNPDAYLWEEEVEVITPLRIPLWARIRCDQMSTWWRQSILMTINRFTQWESVIDAAHKSSMNEMSLLLVLVVLLLMEDELSSESVLLSINNEINKIHRSWFLWTGLNRTAGTILNYDKTGICPWARRPNRMTRTGRVQGVGKTWS